MKKIYLTGKIGQGRYALVDNEDFIKLNKQKWCFDGKYAIFSKKRKNSRRSDHIYMHRVILKLPLRKNSLIEVDHINNNGLDNRKENLRKCTHQQNRANSKLQSNNKTGYKCVVYCNDQKRKKRWKVEMKVNSKKIYIGRFLTKEEAALAYNQAAIKYYGKFANLNYV